MTGGGGGGRRSWPAASPAIRIGKGGAYYGAKVGAEFAVGGRGRRVLVKGIVGYKPATPRKLPTTAAPRRYYAPGGRTYTTRRAAR